MADPPLPPRTPGVGHPREIDDLVAAFDHQLDRLRARRAWATWGLVAAIAAMFVLQSVWGAGRPTSRLTDMGSLIAPRVADGEYGRILASVFLHGGLQHAALNGIALVVLGGFVEKVLGARRLLLLVLVSAIGGNLVSLAFHPTGQSVGASGGVWGLLGAGAVLGFRSGGVLHPALAPGVRRAAAINLGLNILVSFLPRVNMAAHFGGGAAGALLVGTGLLTSGLPRYRPGEDFTRPEAAPVWLTPATVVVVLVYLVGIGSLWDSTRPWLPPSPPDLAWSTVDVERIGIRTLVPTALEAEDESDAGPARFVRWGDLRDAPISVRIGVIERPSGTGGSAQDAGAVADLERQLAAPPDGLSLERAPATVRDAEGPVVSAAWRRDADGVTFDVAALAAPWGDVVVYVSFRAGDRPTYEGTAERIARSVTPLVRRTPTDRDRLRRESGLR